MQENKENVPPRMSRPIPNLVPIAGIAFASSVGVSGETVGHESNPPGAVCGSSSPGSSQVLAPLFTRPVSTCCGSDDGGSGGQCEIESLCRRIKAQPLRQRIIREVICCSSEREVHDVLGSLGKRISGIGGRAAASFIAIAGHPSPGWDHIHVVHDCTYAGSYCKCSWLQEFRRGRGYNGPLPYIGGKAKGDLRPIFAADVRKEGPGYLTNVLR